MQKLAGAAGLLDKKRGDIHGYGNLSASQGYYSSQEDKSQTVGDRLNELLAASQKNYDKELA